MKVEPKTGNEQVSENLKNLNRAKYVIDNVCHQPWCDAAQISTAAENVMKACKNPGKFSQEQFNNAVMLVNAFIEIKIAMFNNKIKSNPRNG